MVVDFTSLQGAMGREYALRSGEPPAVAEAIFEQYLPRGAGDRLPATPAGTVLALADRLDSLVGLFAAGVRPSGAHDPYGLRRTALGLTSILVEGALDLDLRAAVDDAAAGLPLPVGAATWNEVLDFVLRRLEGQLRDAGQAADAVAAVLAVQGHNPRRADQALRALVAHVARPDWPVTLTAYARCARIVRGQGQDEVGPAVDPSRFEAPTEQVLLRRAGGGDRGPGADRRQRRAPRAGRPGAGHQHLLRRGAGDGRGRLTCGPTAWPWWPGWRRCRPAWRTCHSWRGSEPAPLAAMSG